MIERTPEDRARFAADMKRIADKQATHTAHTRGDWRVLDDGTNAQIVSDDAGNFAIAMVYSGGSKYPHNHEERANARLIAAAPDLLKACRFLFGAIADGDLVRDISKDSSSAWALKMMKFVTDLGQVQLAINKAEGQS